LVAALIGDLIVKMKIDPPLCFKLDRDFDATIEFGDV